MRPRRYGSSSDNLATLRVFESINCGGVDLSRGRESGSLKGFFRAWIKKKHWRGLKPWKTRYGIRAARSQTHRRPQRKSRRRELAPGLPQRELRRYLRVRRERARRLRSEQAQQPLRRLRRERKSGSRISRRSSC